MSRVSWCSISCFTRILNLFEAVMGKNYLVLIRCDLPAMVFSMLLVKLSSTIHTHNVEDYDNNSNNDNDNDYDINDHKNKNSNNHDNNNIDNSNNNSSTTTITIYNSSSYSHSLYLSIYVW